MDGAAASANVSSSGSDTSSFAGGDLTDEGDSSSPGTRPPAPPPPPAAATSFSSGGPKPVSTPQPHPQTSGNAATPSNAPRIRHTIPTIISPTGIRLVPRAFQHCELPDIIALIAHMLDRILAHNDSLPPQQPLTRFHSKAAPAITPHAYLTRITTFTNVDPCIIVIILYYIDKLADYLTISSLTIHRFIISAVCCGSKALSDSFATNSRYARVGGVDLVEMNTLEREFLLAINWRLATSGAMLEQYWLTTVEAHPGYQLQQPTSAILQSITYANSQAKPQSSANNVPPARSESPADIRATKRSKGTRQRD